MRPRSPVIPLLFFFALSAGGCMRTLPPMPGVAVVTQTKAAALAEEAATSLAETDDDDEAEYVTPCKNGSFAQHGGELALAAFDDKVRALGDSADPKPLEEELATLLEHPCLEMAKADPKDILTFTSAVSLRHWWREGGSDWLRAYLNADDGRYLRVAPTPRIALTVETAPKGHPLAPLLCPADESKPCATESSGWARRAAQKLELVAAQRHRGKDEIDCRAEAMNEPKAERYTQYRSCLEGGFARRDALPIGRFKAPSDGWLVIIDDHGRCRGVRAFDLKTGSAYSSTDCTRGGPIATYAGRVPVGALREAAWMLVLSGETQTRVRFSQGFHVPDEIPLRRAAGESIGLGVISCGCGPTERRSWSWMRDKNGVLHGQISGVVVGRPDDDTTQHAFDLLDVAGDALDRGCAPSLPPARIAWDSPGRSSNDKEVAVFDDLASEPVRNALAKSKPARTCTAMP